MSCCALRCWTSALLVGCLAAAPICAGHAAKLLPAQADIILTVNLRQFLNDHKNTEVVQRCVEAWGLALRGDHKQLRTYYRAHELHKIETEEEFLKRARLCKAFTDVLGIDLVQDVERITCGFKTNGFFAVIVEGTFKEDTLRTALKRLAGPYVGALGMTRVGEIDLWRPAGKGDGPHLAMLSARTLAITNGKQAMDEILVQASGKGKGLPPAMCALLDKAEKEHIAFVTGNLDALLKGAAKFLEDEAVKIPGAKDVLGKFVIGQAASWVRKYGSAISAESIALSIGPESSRFHFAIETNNPQRAKELGTLIEQSSLLAALALTAIGTDLSRQLADIVSRGRVSINGTTLVVQVEVPHDFVKQVVKELEPNLALLHHPVLEALVRRLTSIPIWGPLQPPPPGTLDVEEVWDVAYRDGPGADPIRHRLDLFLPRTQKDFPVVVLVHGGAWMIGDNRCCGLYSTVGRFLAGQGIGAVLPNYRLSPGARHPDHVKDVARAVAWTRQRIAKYGGDPERIVLLGHSAGGHLVSLLATDESYLTAEGLTTADVRGVLTVSGVYRIPPGTMHYTLGGWGPRALRLDQLFPLRGDGDPFPDLPFGIPATLNVFSPPFGDDPKGRAKASPVMHVRRGLPPFLILTATNDLPTQAGTADEFHQTLRRAGCDSRLLNVDKRNHSSVMFSAITPADPTARAILEFVRHSASPARP